MIGSVGPLKSWARARNIRACTKPLLPKFASLRAVLVERRDDGLVRYRPSGSPDWSRWLQRLYPCTRHAVPPAEVSRTILEGIVLVVGGTLTALVAGLFFSFSVAVNGALHRLKDAEYVNAMQSINLVILNRVFLPTFLAPVFLLPIGAYLYFNTSFPRFALLLVASLFYVVGTFGITVGGNVPLNNRLAGFDMSRASPEEVAQARARFEGPWNRLHAVRTVASIAATVSILVASVFT